MKNTHGLPLYPIFHQVELHCKVQIEEVTQTLPPYSTIQFASMYCWNYNGDISYSTLNGNLVVLSPDLCGNKPSLSLFGTNKISECLEVLSRTITKTGIVNLLVPEETHQVLGIEKFTSRESSEDHEYVYSVDQFSYAEKSLKSKLRGLRQFLKHLPDPVVRLLDPKNLLCQKEIEQLLSTWVANKKLTGKQDTVSDLELSAIRRFFDIGDTLHFQTVGVYDNSRLIAFCVNELPVRGKDCAITHFWKADIAYPGIYAFLFNRAATLLPKWVKWLNWEEDHGIEGIRTMKLSYRPQALMKKYLIRL